MKTFFLTRQLREKLLLVGVVGVGLAFWIMHLVAANQAYRTDETKTFAARTEQEGVLSRATAIIAKQQETIKQLDPAQSITNEPALAEAMQALAAEVPGLNFNYGKPLVSPPSKVSPLTIIKVDVTLTGLSADNQDLLAFYRKLEEKAPYINIVNSIIRLNGGRGGRGGGAAGAGGGFGGQAGQPGGGFGGQAGQPGGGGPGGRGRGANPTTTIGALDVPQPGARPTNVVTTRVQQTGPRVNATFSLVALSLNSAAARSAVVPARPTAPAAPAPIRGG